MNPNLGTHACDPARLESFLNGDLGDAHDREFTAHLETCENCRLSLQRQAAEPEAWMEAEELLKPCPFDVPGADEGFATRQPFPIQTVLDALGPTDDPAMLGRLGGYEISGVVGAGGMGVVLKAVDASLDRTVAIKVLAPHLAASGAARQRFAREAKAAAAVLHPNVIAIHGVWNDKALPYLVMPYLRGTSLQKRLEEDGPLPIQDILRIGSQIAAGLAAAHAQGLVHRDIKPANILLEEGVERLTITDFGLARAVDDATITRSGVIAGTPQYMSPEQARGEAVDQRSDLFSLGSVLYALCTGRPPFRAETPYGVIRRINDDEPRSIREINPEIPDWLCAIVSRLMSKDAPDRFDSAAEAGALLEECLAHVQEPAAVTLPASLVPETTRRRPFHSQRTGLIAMFGTLSFALLGMVFWQASEAPDIAGKWSSEHWGRVVLKETDEGEYTGSFSETVSGQPGKIELKWSRIERRFNGTWREGEEGKARFGELSVRLVDDEVRGAYTTDRESKINPATPHLADLLWVKAGIAQKPSVPGEEPSAAPKPSVENVETEEDRLWNVYGVTPEPVSDSTAKVLEWIGLSLDPTTKASFREKNVFADYPGGLSVTFFRNGGPAHKAGFAYGSGIVVALQGQPTLTLEDLDAAMQLALEQIERGEADSLQFDVLLSGKTRRVNVPLPVGQLDSRTLGFDNDTTSETQSAESPKNQHKPDTPRPEASDVAVESPPSKPLIGQEKAAAKLVLVFFQDRSRRAVPCILMEVAGRTFVVTAGPSGIIPEGAAHAIDDTFIEVPGEAPILVEYDERSTPELFIHRAMDDDAAARLDQLDSIRLQEPATVDVGETVYALSIFEPVGLARTSTRVVALNRPAELKVSDTGFIHKYDGLIQVNKTFREGMPLYKDGKLVGLVLLGSRFLGKDANKSYVVPAERIVELLERIEHDAGESIESITLSHEVPFEIGATKLRGGDRITIKEVRGTAETIRPDNVYEIEGTYKLASRDKATLAAFVTDMAGDGKSQTRKSQTITVERGEGTFTLRLMIPYKGKPHISFYSISDGEGFGGVYFGTGDSVLKKGWREDSPNREGEATSKTTHAKPDRVHLFQTDEEVRGHRLFAEGQAEATE